MLRTSFCDHKKLTQEYALEGLQPQEANKILAGASKLENVLNLPIV